MTADLIGRRLLLGGAIGGLAITPSRAQSDTTFTNFAFPATGAATPRTMPDRLADIKNVKDFGARGDGVTDDTAAIQTTFDAAFGPPSSPHGNRNRFMNRPVFFPAGNYQISRPLYLKGVTGGYIFGSGSQSTRLAYTGLFNGNTVVQNGITPVIMTNGFAYSRIEGLNLAIGNNNSTCLYIFQDGTEGPTTGNTFADILVETALTGFLIGYQSNALCSENLFLNCTALSCGAWGFRNISSNALNNNFVGCGAAASGLAGFSCPTGSIQIHCASLAQNGVDIATGQNPMTIIGCRTESANFIDMTSTQSLAYIAGCVHAAGAGAGTFINLGSQSTAIIDACIQESKTSTDGLISGSANSRVYIRGCDFRNASFLSSYTGKVLQNI
jgi:hypothetical protein